MTNEINRDGIFICTDESGDGEGAEAGGQGNGPRLALKLPAAGIRELQD